MLGILFLVYKTGIVLFTLFVISQNIGEPLGIVIRNVFIGFLVSLVWPIAIIWGLFIIYVIYNSARKSDASS